MSTTIEDKIAHWQAEVEKLIVDIAQAQEDEVPEEEVKALEIKLVKAEANWGIWKKSALTKKEFQSSFQALEDPVKKMRQPNEDIGEDTIKNQENAAIG